MGIKIIKYLLIGLLLLITADFTVAQESLVLPSSKTKQVTVPKVVGMKQSDAEAALAKIGLAVARVIERETKLKDGMVVRQQPLPNAKVAQGSGVVLVVSKKGAKAAVREPLDDTTAPQVPDQSTKQGERPGAAALTGAQLPSFDGRQFSDVFTDLRKLGFKEIKPQNVRSSDAKGTILGYQVDGEPAETERSYSLTAVVTVLISSGIVPVGHQQPNATMAIDTAPIIMTGLRTGSQAITTQPIIMTGIRAQSLTIITDPMQMTGKRVQSQTITTQPLQMTGKRAQSLTIITNPMQMTGKRVQSQTITTQPLQMTGMR
jgi:beta-lactam-binding protein with PASTA domain